MGYRSNIRVMTDLENFEIMQDIIWELAEEKNLAPQYVMFPEDGANPDYSFDYYDAQKNWLCFGFDWVKWYDNYKCVSLFMDMLDVANNRGVHWQFIRIGEEYGDVERMESDNFYDTDIPVMGVSMEITY